MPHITTWDGLTLIDQNGNQFNIIDRIENI